MSEALRDNLTDGLTKDAQPTFASLNLPKSYTEIWIAEDVCINCRAKYHWWNKVFLRLVFGWKVKEIK